MSYLLDTNVVSELRKREKANRGLLRWFGSVTQERLYLSALVIGELWQGIESIRRRDSIAAARLESWFSVVVSDFEENILPVDAAVAVRWGALNVPDRLPTVDGLLAATAMVHNLTLVTRNVKDTATTGVRTLNPFSS